ncbi:uncharacterized protein [Cherax quadricarinatus]|uniref:uncharacterized protein n=1 Tax=Cherax quadricarinatus TaxID=27406 RepID=UPI00387E43CD
MNFPGGQDTYEKEQAPKVLNGGYFACYPTSDGVLDDFDMSLLDEEYTVSPINSVGYSPPTYHCNDSWTAGDATAVSHFATQATATEGWSAGGPAGGSDQPLFPWTNDGQTASLTGRKLKAYELPPQSDPKLEKKRLRAIKALKNRLRRSEQEENQYKKLDALTQDVSRLRSEKITKEQKVAALQVYLSQLAISSLPQHTGKCYSLTRFSNSVIHL